MNIWTCKTATAACALSLLAACEGGLSSITAKPNAEALSQAPMAFGAVTLVPPSGYCIDGESLKQRFALLARCDQLGAEGGTGGVPLGVMTVSVTPLRDMTTLPTPAQTAGAHALTAASDPQTTEDSVVFRARGAAFSEQVSQDHWRGSAIINKQVIGLALYGPSGGGAISDQGRSLLAELIKRTQERSR